MVMVWIGKCLEDGEKRVEVMREEMD